MSEDELIRSACEFFGWRRTGKDMRECLQQDISDLFAQGNLTGGPSRITAVR